MKRVSCRITYALLLAVAFLFASCSKDGDAGPKGDTGAQGPKGDKGDEGSQGDSGVANVIYSDWLDVTYQPNVDSSAWAAIIEAPKLDKNILNTGSVKVYLNLGIADDPTVVSLPYFDGDFIINVTTWVDTIRLVSNANLGTVAQNGVKRQQVRYVLIPGGTTARQARPINWSNYQEVKEYLGWND